MLPKSKRLNLKKSYSWVRSGFKFEDDLVRVFFKLGDNKEAKVGITTSSSIFKKATDRNRARRLISSSFEEAYQQLPININLVVLPKEKMLQSTVQQRQESVVKIINEISHH